MKVSFSPEEILKLEQAGKARSIEKSDGHFTVQVDQTRESADIHIEGIWGEFAVSKVLGSEMDWTVYVGKGDGGILDQTYKGKSLQIKATRYKKGGLLYNSPHKLKADIHILAIVDIENNEVEVAGWVTREQFHERKSRKLTRVHHQNRVVDQKDLNPIEDLR